MHMYVQREREKELPANTILVEAAAECKTAKRERQGSTDLKRKKTPYRKDWTGSMIGGILYQKYSKSTAYEE